MDRRTLLSLSLPVAASALGGCITNKMNRETRYAENIGSVLISADKKNLVVLGAKHHYIFEAPRALLVALSPDLNPAIAGASFNTFTVDSSNGIQGDVRLMLRHDATQEQRAFAASLGFQGTASPVLPLTMRGTRYTAPPQFEGQLAQRLKRTYAINVIEKPGAATTMLKAAATPITKAADGLLVIGAVVLSPILLTLLIANY